MLQRRTTLELYWWKRLPMCFGSGWRAGSRTPQHIHVQAYEDCYFVHSASIHPLPVGKQTGQEISSIRAKSKSWLAETGVSFHVWRAHCTNKLCSFFFNGKRAVKLQTSYMHTLILHFCINLGGGELYADSKYVCKHTTCIYQDVPYQVSQVGIHVLTGPIDPCAQYGIHTCTVMYMYMFAFAAQRITRKHKFFTTLKTSGVVTRWLSISALKIYP